MLNKIKSLATLNNAKAIGQWFKDDVKANPLAWVTVVIAMVMLAALGVHMVDMVTMDMLVGHTIALYAMTGALVLGFVKTITQ